MSVQRSPDAGTTSGRPPVPGAVPVRQKGEMTFGKTLLAAMLGNLAAGVAILILGGLIIGFMIAGALSSAVEETVVLDDSLLEITLSGSIPESQVSVGLVGLLEGAPDYTFLELIIALRKAAEDDRIPGVRLNLHGFSGSSAQYEELVEAIDRFGSSGKFVYAVSDTDGFSEGEYFVASAADSIFLYRSGGIELNGLYVVLEFYRPLMEKLNVKPIVVRAGSYKAAVEPFTRSEPSEEYREATTEILEGIQEVMIETIATHREIPVGRIEAIMQEYPILRAEDALDFGLVDRLVYDDELDSLLLGRLDSDRDAPRTISLDEYIGMVREEMTGQADGAVAVVYADGAITTGRGGHSPNPIMGGEQAGSSAFIENLREAREADEVRAIVIRVNSPGGELPPSVEMWREVALAADEKPVVVSMGGVAASGGYYIAAPATEIFADATTVTGSIGVFALAFNLDGFYEETIGINTEVISTAPHADLLSLTRDLTDDELRFAAEEIDEVYVEFLQVVADGRAMTLEQVRKVAEGRVWTGRQARRLGLVDDIGGLHAAIERAALLAEIDEEYDIRVIPRPMDEVERIFSALDQFAHVADVSELMNIAAYRTALHEDLLRRSGLQVRMPGWGGVAW